VIAFLKGNSKIGLRQAVDHVPYSFELYAKMAEEIDLEKCNFPNFTSSVICDLDLDLGSGRGHTGAHIWWRSTHTPN